MALGWNYVVKDKKLFISQCDWLEPIEKKRNAVEKEISRLELKNTQDPQRQNTPFGVVCPILRDLADDVRTAFYKENDSTIYIPTLI